ncbi:MAG: protein kinase [Candidatus Wallbacteria bacterium]|nr:protein kinase [Candidatus Wallbacteria bacterium]
MNPVFLEKGTLISGCTVIEQVGEGGMGVVYKGFDQALDRPVAIKIMNPLSGKTAGERFLREARLLAQCRHHGVVQIYSFGEHQGFPYFVMEYVEGNSLESFIKKARMVSGDKYKLDELLEMGYLKESDPELPYFLRDPLRPPLSDPEYLGRVNSLIAEIADTLSEVHRLGIVHRDIKPANILICTDGEVKLVDFGLAKTGDSLDLTRTEQMIGTINYMSPEQFQGKKARITPLTDIYSLGATYYELATLRRPVEEEDIPAIVAGITEGRFPEPHELNPAITSRPNSIILKCLRTKETDRFQSAAELADEIRRSGRAFPIFQGVRDFFLQLSAKQEVRKKMLSLKSGGEISIAAIGHDGNISAARALYEEARNDFFVKMKFVDAVDKLMQALELHPTCIDALLLLYNAYSSSFELRSLEERLPAARAAEGSLTESDLLKLEILEKTIKHGEKSTSELYRCYLKVYPADEVILYMDYLASYYDTDFDRALTCLEQILAVNPEYNRIYFEMSEIYAGMGKTEKALKIMESRAEKYPDLIELNLVTLEQLILTGRFEEAGKKLANVLEDDPSLDWALSMMARVEAARNHPEAACNRLRQAIGSTRSDFEKSRLYYLLYRMHESFGNPDKAAQTLQICRNIGFERNFLSLAEIETRIVSCDLSGLNPGNFRPEFTELIKKFIRRSCLQGLDFRCYGAGSFIGTVSCYEMSGSGSCSIFKTWSEIVFRTRRVEEVWVHLAEIPSTPFSDGSGRIQEAKIKKCPTAFGNYLAAVKLSEPVKNGEALFLSAEYEPIKLTENGNGLEFSIPDYPFNISREQIFLISVPDSLKVDTISLEPDETVKLENSKILVFSRFFHSGEKLPLKLRFRKTA